MLVNMVVKHYVAIYDPLNIWWYGVQSLYGGLMAAQLEIPPRCSSLSVVAGRHFYFEQIRVLKAG